MLFFCFSQRFVGNGANTVSGSTVSNTELSEFFGAHRVPARELSEFLSAYYLCAKANSPSSPQNSPSLSQNSVRLIEFSPPKQYSRNSIPRPFPNSGDKKADKKEKAQKSSPELRDLVRVFLGFFWCAILSLFVLSIKTGFFPGSVCRQIA